MAADITTVVLAGGRATRFGSDKLAAPLGGTAVLDHLLDALPPGWRVVLVGAVRDTGRSVTWTREDPPGGGPLSAVAAGMAVVDTSVVAVVAGDMPYAAPALVALTEVLRTAPEDVAAAVAADRDDVPNPLLAAYRSRALRSALPGDPRGVPARTLLDLPHVVVPVPGVAALDVDTPADLAGLATDPRRPRSSGPPRSTPGPG